EFYHKEKGEGVKFESDIAPFKPRGDIVLVGKACAPGATSVGSMDVSLHVGNISKIIRVFGDRRWEYSGRLLSTGFTDPEPFTEMELTYERAFGGIDTVGGGWCRENPFGRGFIAKKTKEAVDGVLLPNLEDPEDLINSWDDHPNPVGFGFYGRSAMPRAGYMGTYDDKWREERSPDPPLDFKFDYYNAANPDLQVEGYLKGDETVEIVNMTPDGRMKFKLPDIKLFAAIVRFKRQKKPMSMEEEFWNEENNDNKDGKEEDINLNLDTLCIIPDENRFYLVWRGIYQIQDLTAAEVKRVSVDSYPLTHVLDVL
ncbi:DUF2169 domain-containing protein, partial [Candidatus Poribacteria bacterium]|nr:DUF2169 domain-containing protein [Candidatus Poribacteria bacterium]